jgi:hypothetical protein
MKSNQLMAGLAIAFFAGISTTGMAFAHSHLVVMPDESDHAQMNANPIVMTLGHGNEPAFGVKPGVHDGKHDFELSIEDEATTLPVAGANLTLDRYYFRDFRTFERASSVESATEVEKGIPLGGVFGQPGTYSVGQVVTDGIYGYRVYGTIDYFGVAQLPVDATVFCASSEGNTTKFNSPGWVGSFGCVDDIGSLLFPENNSAVNAIDADASQSGLQEVDLQESSPNGPSGQPLNSLQIVGPAMAGAAVAVFLGLRRREKHSQQ